ncbi:MAG: hypothetical protein O7H41_07020 [Planctomycetota bacterium]|nr:hypothetical protein [Planctomycetota bacterium]
MRSSRLLVLVVVMMGLTFLTQGCMTVVRGTTQEIKITSKPSGATVEILGPKPPSEVVEISGGVSYIKSKVEWKAIGTTPIEIKLRRNQSYTVRCTKDGYKPAEDEINRRLSGVFYPMFLVPNLILGGLIDLSSGAAYYLDKGTEEKPLHFVLRKSN